MKNWTIPPSICQWDITGRCNLNCKHCRAKDVREIKNDMGGCTAISILDQLYDLNPEIILALAGGEPLARPDLLDILVWIKNRQSDAQIEILSNGTLINKNNVAWLKELCSGFNISLEGASAGVNDAIRGKGAFEKAVGGVKLLVRNKVPVCVRMTYFHQGEDEVEQLMRLLPEIGVAAFNFRYLVPVGSAQAEKVCAVQYERLCQIIWKLGKELNLRVGFSDPFPELLIDPKSKAETEDDAELLSGKAVSGCSMAFSLLYIDPEGLVKACPYLPIPCDDAKIKPLSEIWFENEILNRLRFIRSSLDGGCGECAFKFACGGCRGAAYTAGNLLGSDPRCWQ